MRAPDPAARLPLWTRREFRWLVAGAFLCLSVIAVVIFEIAPLIRRRSIDRVHHTSGTGAAFVPGNRSADVAFDGLLDKTVDGTPADAWDDPYVLLAKHVQRSTKEEVAKGALNVQYDHFAAHAAELRGRPVEVIALMAYTTPLRVPRPGTGLEFIHRSILVDMTGEHGYIVDTLEPLPPVDRRQLVKVPAMFLKMASFESEGGTRTVPLLIGREVSIIVEDRGTATLTVGAIVIGVCGLALVVVMVLSRRASAAKWNTPRLRPVPVPKQP
jgi:hypothetical protein